MLRIWLKDAEDISAILEKYKPFIQNYFWNYNNTATSAETVKILFNHDNLRCYDKVITIVVKGNPNKITDFLRRKIEQGDNHLISFYLPAVASAKSMQCLRSMTKQTFTVTKEVQENLFKMVEK